MKNMLVSFVVVAFNAGNNMDDLFDCLNKQTYPHENIEVILVDGLSIDDTKEKMISFSKKENNFNRVIVIDNPKTILPAGWNIALKEYKGEAVIRVDAHTKFSEDFIKLNVSVINSGEDICAGKVISIPTKNDNYSIVLNEAENSMFGGGIAAFRHSERPRYVKTAAFAMYRKTVFDKVGSYNELLKRTEDNEMHFRMRKAGYKFYYDPKIIIYRKTRTNLTKLIKQKFGNGYWIGITLGVEPHCFSAYHFVPLMFFIAILITTIISFAFTKIPMIILWSLYCITNLIMSVLTTISSKNRNGLFLFLPLIFFALHVFYGVGTLLGILKMVKTKI